MSAQPFSTLLILAAILGDLTIGSAERLSGLYVDNGFDQTVVHRVVSQYEKREVEHEILNLLGLPDRPRNTIGRTPQVKRSAPKFLLDIYKNALGEDEEEKPLARSHKAGEFDLSGQDLRAIDQSDVIMTFAAHNHHVPGVRHERGKRLWFDVSEVPPEEYIIGAELRLYHSAHTKIQKSHGSHTITAYRVLNTKEGIRELQYIDAINITDNKQGWLTLNISEAFEHWVKDSNENRGLYLSVHPADRSVRPEDIGIMGFRGDPDKQPFIVGYFKSSGVRESKVRQKRDAKRKKKSEATSWDYRNNPYTDPGAQYSRTCKIQTLYVSFRDLQWQDWIIAPDGYDAYYCSGECNFPLNAHMNATNHAIVQTLVHLVSPGKVPKPCCAPTKLSAISVLYFLDESNVILKKYKNMVVKSCGCH
ncbi:Protein 60A [Trachymyrmex septentrionalis]|uniref:Protein 60A n=1 Tax=Trachymyrmex septentrionalis TaxID=34720 RepID=A0A195FVG3_9HYME|nr:Protein 60A [Trachymyrmex septentrionalis]